MVGLSLGGVGAPNLRHLVGLSLGGVGAPNLGHLVGLYLGGECKSIVLSELTSPNFLNTRGPARLT